jgi:hypothetical protein
VFHDNFLTLFHAEIHTLASLIFLALVASAVSSVLLYLWRTGCPPLPSTPKATKAMLDMLPPHINGTLYELGSGFGTFAFALAKKFPKAQIRAIEISPIPHFTSRIIQLILRFPNLTFERRDLFDVPLQNAAAVTCYLVPSIMAKLRSKFSEELAPSTPVVCNWFSFLGMEPARMTKLDDLYRSPVYLYHFSGRKNDDAI